jgi:hypothetical protein
MLVVGIALANSVVAASAAPIINACSLLQPVEIKQVLGRAVEPGQRLDAGVEPNGAYSSSCLWLLQGAKPVEPGSGLAGRNYVILNAMQWPAGSGKARSFLESFHEAKASGVLTAALVPKAFGDEALWWGDGLAVVRRDVSFGLSIRHPAGRTQPPGASEERLARTVLQRLDERHANPGRAGSP